jgi:hypothetical protein
MQAGALRGPEPRREIATRRFSASHLQVWCAPNDLAFSCERTKSNSDQEMMVGAFVGCNGLLGGAGQRTA